MKTVLELARDHQSAIVLAAKAKADSMIPYVAPVHQPRKWNFEDLVMEAAAHDNYRSFISKQFTK